MLAHGGSCCTGQGTVCDTDGVTPPFAIFSTSKQINCTFSLDRTSAPIAEFTKIAQATSVGFAIMGFIGFFVKLIFIPINNIIVGMG